MKNPSELLIILFSIVLFSCNSKKEFVITGNITGFPDSTKVFLRNLSTDHVFDSTLVLQNKFKFSGQLQSPPEQIWLNMRVDKKFIYTNLLIGNDKIHIQGDLKDFPWNVKVTGSKTQDDFIISQNMTKQNNIKRNILLQKFFKLSKEDQQKEHQNIWGEIRNIDKENDSLNLLYIKSHPDSYSSVITLGYLKNKLHKDTIQSIFNNYTPKIKNSKYAKIIAIYLKEKISKVGDIYHDFEAFDKNSEKIVFSKIKKNYTLLDFTAANCGPCIQSVEELKDLNKTYKDSLTIISFSCDAKKETWLNSLKRDSISWTSVWDGKGRYSETSIKYGVSGFPTFFLIDPEGKIIDKWGGYRKGALKNKLKKILTK